MRAEGEGHAWQEGFVRAKGEACIEGVMHGWGGHGKRGMHGRGKCMAGGMHGGGMCGRGHTWWGVCDGVCVVKGGMRGRGGGRAWKERRPLQRTVHILLEYILVSFLSKISVHTSWEVNLKSPCPDTEFTGNKTNNLLSSV